MADISGFGLQITLIASNTFPFGISLTQFADDADPFDIPTLQVAETAMGLNGELLSWSKPNPIKVTLNVVPQSDDDVNLGILLDANRVAFGKDSARDLITLVGIYPDGTVTTLVGGKITEGMTSTSVASASRMKSKMYGFSFGDTNTV